jgi:hypothetical protein
MSCPQKHKSSSDSQQMTVRTTWVLAPQSKKTSKVKAFITSVVDPKYRIKSAALYDKYLESRERPLISLDNYQVNYCWILERIPIFIPYRQEYFNFYKNRYQMAKKTGSYNPIPK